MLTVQRFSPTLVADELVHERDVLQLRIALNIAGKRFKSYRISLE